VCVCNQDMVDVIKNLMPSRSFSEMLKMLKQFVSFMSMTVSGMGVVNQIMYHSNDNSTLSYYVA